MNSKKPLTGKEVKIPVNTIVVSKTDLKGHITYVNDEFVKLSGLSREELLGKNHNFNRHPDVPKKVFVNLWETIKSGQPWTHIIKSRTSNGDHLWFRANITPITKNGKIVEYMSVRTKPSAEEIRETQQYFNDCNAGRENLENTGFNKYILAVRNMNLTHKIYASVVVSIVLQMMTAFGILLNIEPAILISSLVITSFVTFLLGTRISREVSSPLLYAISKLKLMTEGNYFDWINTDRYDEFGNLLRAIKSSQIKLGFDMTDAKDTVDLALRIKTKLSSIATHLQGSADKMQASTIDFNEITELVHENSLSLNEAKKLSEHTKSQAEDGGEALKCAIDSIKEVEDMNRKISDNVGIIDEIAFKTNLLALNAAVEAAHAGDEGRGFAVVAEEVRNLAMSSAEAARRIKELTQNSVLKANHGYKLVTESGQSINKAIDSVNEVNQLIAGIAKAGDKQKSSFERVFSNFRETNKAIQNDTSNVVTVVQESAALTNQAMARAN